MPAQINAPPPPYYAVIFTSRRSEVDAGYSAAAKRMLELAAQQPGFLGFETARQDLGISVSYWTSLEAIKAWKENPEHRAMQNKAKEWYCSFRVRVCRVQKDYGF